VKIRYRAGMLDGGVRGMLESVRRSACRQ